MVFMKTCVMADLHIKVPIKYKAWYVSRFLNLIKQIPDDIDELWLAGDIFDQMPSYMDVALFMKLLNNDTQIRIIEGNHDYTGKSRYLKSIVDLADLSNVDFIDGFEKRIINGLPVYFCSHRHLKYNNYIPNNEGILVSHIRCDLPQFNKKGEYDFNNLSNYELVLLGDIHNMFNYNDKVFYTSSPYRTHKKTIKSLREVDNKFYGFLIFENGKVTKHETNLPNIYKWEQEGDYIEPPIDDNIYEIELLTTYENAEKYNNEDIGITIVSESSLENVIHDDFEKSILEYIKYLTGADPAVFMSELYDLGVLREDT